MNKQIKTAVKAKLAQWDREATLSAARAIKTGKAAVLVTYPTGLEMMRFAEPFTDCGMHYEVPPQVWAALVETNGTIYA
jgi:hypothetical protein